MILFYCVMRQVQRVNIVARLILSRLKLDDLLDIEMQRLQQEEVNYQREMTSSGPPSLTPDAVSTVSSQTSFQLLSTPVSQTASASSSSQPFQLPDVNISELLSTTIQSPTNFQLPLAGYQRTSALVSPASSISLFAPSQQLPCTDRGIRNKSNNKKKVNDNCRQNNLRNSDKSPAANGNKPSSVTKTSDDSQKRESVRRSTLAQDSDDEFDDCYRVAKKRVKQTRQDDWTDDSRLAAAVIEVDKANKVESCSKRDKTAAVTDITSSPASYRSDVHSSASNSPVMASVAAADGASLQRSVAQRLSKFAFNDSLLRQRQEPSITGNVASVKSTSPRHCIGNCHCVIYRTQAYAYMQGACVGLYCIHLHVFVNYLHTCNVERSDGQ